MSLLLQTRLPLKKVPQAKFSWLEVFTSQKGSSFLAQTAETSECIVSLCGKDYIEPSSICREPRSQLHIHIIGLTVTAAAVARSAIDKELNKYTKQLKEHIWRSSTDQEWRSSLIKQRIFEFPKTKNDATWSQILYYDKYSHIRAIYGICRAVAQPIITDSGRIGVLIKAPSKESSKRAFDYLTELVAQNAYAGSRDGKRKHSKQLDVPSEGVSQLSTHSEIAVPPKRRKTNDAASSSALQQDMPSVNSMATSSSSTSVQTDSAYKAIETAQYWQEIPLNATRRQVDPQSHAVQSRLERIEATVAGLQLENALLRQQIQSSNGLDIIQQAIPNLSPQTLAELFEQVRRCQTANARVQMHQGQYSQQELQRPANFF